MIPNGTPGENVNTSNGCLGSFGRFLWIVVVGY